MITKLIASKNYFCKEVFCNNFGRDGNVFVNQLSARSDARERYQGFASPGIFASSLAALGSCSKDDTHRGNDLQGERMWFPSADSDKFAGTLPHNGR